jgi:hypothetical protein
MRVRHRAAIAAATSAVTLACGATSTTPPSTPKPASIVLPARNIHLRASFDNDPSTYLGRFIPDGVPENQADESVAVATRCSQFIKPKLVTSQQELDEVMFASQNASGALGVPLVGHAGASHDATSALRVKYELTRKMQADVDAVGLDRCCHDAPDQCSKRYVGEFVMGSGQIYQQTGSDTDMGAGGTYHGVSADVEYKDSVAWKRVSSFKDTFFAMQSNAAMGALSATPPAVKDDCSFCDNLPTSLDGKYFCGISPDAPSESMARDYAMRNAREQVIKYMGEYLMSRSATEASLLKGYTDDAQVITAGAEGIASRVKDQKWCKAERTPTPDGMRYRSRVLAFLSNDQLAGAARDAIETLISKRKTARTITPDQEKALRDLVK